MGTEGGWVKFTKWKSSVISPEATIEKTNDWYERFDKYQFWTILGINLFDFILELFCKNIFVIILTLYTWSVIPLVHRIENHVCQTECSTHKIITQSIGSFTEKREYIQGWLEHYQSNFPIFLYFTISHYSPYSTVQTYKFAEEGAAPTRCSACQ